MATSKVNRLRAYFCGALANYLTTGDAYADVGVFSTVNLNGKIFEFTGATNNLQVKVLGSIDLGATYTVVLETDIAVAAAATVQKTYTASATVPHVTNIKIQTRPASAGQHGTLSTKFFGFSM